MEQLYGICGYLSTIIQALIISIVIINEWYIYYKEKRRNTNNFLDEPLYKEGRNWTSSFVLYFNIILSIVILGCIATLLIIIVGNDNHVCSNYIFYVNTSLKFIGFALCYHTLKQIRKKMRILGHLKCNKRRIFNCIFFSLTQSISGFYHSCYYGVGNGDSFSIVLILYFIISSLLLLLSTIFYLKMDNNDLFDWKTFSFSSETYSSSYNNSISEVENGNVDVKSLWRARRDEKTKNDTIVDVFSRFSFSSATSSELSISVEKADLENYKVRAFTNNNSPQKFSPSPASALGGLFSFWKNSLLRSDDYTPSSSLFVIEWGSTCVNSKTIIHYKLGLGETATSTDINKRTVKIISKRHDELCFLKQKLLIEYPAVTFDPIPIVDIDIDSEITGEIFERHRDEMNAYFEKLITNPICGRAVILNLKNNLDEDMSFSNNSKLPTVSSPSRKISSICELGDHLDPLLPFCPFDNRLLNIQVVGWTTFDNNIYYDVEVKSSSSSWLSRKRFSQFLSLYTALELTWELPRGVVCPVKNIIKEKANDRDNEIKYNENTLALAAFIKSIAVLNPVPNALLAFLEADVISRSNGYDIIKGFTGLYQTQKTTLEHLAKRKESAVRLCQNFKSMKNPLNIVSSLLPSISPNNNDYDNNGDDYDNDSNDEENEKDSIFTTKNSSFFSSSLSKKAKLSQSKLLSLPGILLDDLLSLLRYLKFDRVQSKTFTEMKSDQLPGHCINIIDSTGSNSNSVQWIMQWRLNQIVLSTTAFHEILVRIAALKELSFNNLKDISVNDDVVIIFLINLYNLMTLHASIVTPWSLEKKDQIKRKHDTRYKFASGSVSLMQIEHYLLYAKNFSVSFNHPTFLPSTDYSIPSPAELGKTFGQLHLTKSNPLLFFLLGQPYKSGVKIQAVVDKDNLTTSLSTSISEFLKRNILINSKSIILPNILRRLGQGLNESEETYSFDDNLEIDNLIETLEKSVGPQPGAVSLSDWDRAEIIFGGAIDSIDGDELISKMNQIPLGIINKQSQGNFLICESQFVKLKTILNIGVEARDRTSMFVVYPNCFVGKDAVKAIIASGQGSDKDEAIGLLNLLIEYGYIQNVVKEHWMQDEDHVFFNYLNYDENLLLDSITKLLMKYYKLDNTNTSATTKYLQLMKILKSKSNIYYGVEDYNFSYPI